MARLTPLSKGLLTLIVIGGAMSIAWHNGLKDKLGAYLPGTAPKPQSAAQPAPSASPAPTAAPPVAPAPTPSPAAATPPAAASKPAPVSSPPTPSPAPAANSAMPPKQAFDEGRRALEAGDHARARQLLDVALRGGEAGAACLLGEMTLAGQGGLAVDRDKAAEYYRIAQSKNIICFGASR